MGRREYNHGIHRRREYNHGIHRRRQREYSPRRRNWSQGQGAVSSGKNLTFADPVEGVHVEEVSEEEDSAGSEDTEEPVEGVLVEVVSETEDSAGSEDMEVDNSSEGR